jgi:hypothetical protein
MIDVTKMSINEIIHLIVSDPELIKRLGIAKSEQDRREAEKAKREQEQKEANYNRLVHPIIDAVIISIKEISEPDYDYEGETHIFTDKGKIVINGIISEVLLNE